MALAGLLDITPQAFLKICCKAPDLIYRDAATMSQRIAGFAGMLGTTPQRFVRSCLILSGGAAARACVGGRQDSGDVEAARHSRKRLRPHLSPLPCAPAASRRNHSRERCAHRATARHRYGSGRPHGGAHADYACPFIANLKPVRGAGAWSVLDFAGRSPAGRWPLSLTAEAEAETADRNLTRLQALTGLERDQVVRAALRLPQLFYLRPDKVADKLDRIAKQLKLEPGVVAEAFARMPTLAGREPSTMARRVRIVQRIACALGEPVSAATVLTQYPAAPTYSTERLLLRHLIARLGLWEGRWTSLLAMRDDTVRSRLKERLAMLPPTELPALRLRRLIARRLGD